MYMIKNILLIVDVALLYYITFSYSLLEKISIEILQKTRKKMYILNIHTGL